VNVSALPMLGLRPPLVPPVADVENADARAVMGLLAFFGVRVHVAAVDTSMMFVPHATVLVLSD